MIKNNPFSAPCDDEFGMFVFDQLHFFSDIAVFRLHPWVRNDSRIFEPQHKLLPIAIDIGEGSANELLFTWILLIIVG